jgi:hypothetical protein
MLIRDDPAYFSGAGIVSHGPEKNRIIVTVSCVSLLFDIQIGRRVWAPKHEPSQSVLQIAVYPIGYCHYICGINVDVRKLVHRRY